MREGRPFFVGVRLPIRVEFAEPRVDSRREVFAALGEILFKRERFVVDRADDGSSGGGRVFGRAAENCDGLAVFRGAGNDLAADFSLPGGGVEFTLSADDVIDVDDPFVEADGVKEKVGSRNRFAGKERPDEVTESARGARTGQIGRRAEKRRHLGVMTHIFVEFGAFFARARAFLFRVDERASVLPGQGVGHVAERREAHAGDPLFEFGHVNRRDPSERAARGQKRIPRLVAEDRAERDGGSRAPVVGRTAAKPHHDMLCAAADRLGDLFAESAGRGHEGVSDLRAGKTRRVGDGDKRRIVLHPEGRGNAPSGRVGRGNADHPSAVNLRKTLGAPLPAVEGGKSRNGGGGVAAENRRFDGIANGSCRHTALETVGDHKKSHILSFGDGRATVLCLNNIISAIL